MTQFPQTLTHLSYSAVKVFLESPEEFKHQYIDGNKPDRTKAMSLGSLVDCMLTTPDKFEEEYAIQSIDKPSSSAQQNAFADEIVETYIQGIQPEADEVWKHHFSSKGKSEEAIVSASKDLFTAWKSYMEWMIDVKKNDKIVITKNEHQKALDICEAVKNHPMAAKWLVSIEGEFQKELRWKSTVSDIEILGYVDKVIIDHDAKRAMVIDFKVSAIKNEHQFKGKVRQYKYHMQAWSYITGIQQQLFNETGETYKVDHMYIVANSEAPHQVMCIRFDDNDLERGATDFYYTLEEINQRLISGNWRHNDKLIKLKVFSDN
ncbi:MAG: PD-(D/E)XK nuclease-like domain-containing protein [Candidatus Heimdallarchaeaceae archaeon]|jgi:hypothetical protein